MNSKIKDIVDNISKKNSTSLKENLEKVIAEKAADVLEMRKVKMRKIIRTIKMLTLENFRKKHSELKSSPRMYRTMIKSFQCLFDLDYLIQRN